jgi:phosphatidylethanolamine-binding protein
MSNFNVRIGDIVIQNGMFIPFGKSQSKPKINFDRYPNDKYTIVMVDPDAPSRNNPIYKYWLHLLIINNNEKIISHEPPSPPIGSGKHRYIFFLLKQPGTLDKNKLIITNNITKHINNFDNCNNSGKNNFGKSAQNNNQTISTEVIVNGNNNNVNIERKNFNFGEFIQNNKLEIVGSICFETERS